MITVGGSDPVLDQATPCDEQLLHIADRLTDDRPGLQSVEGAETSEHGGVDSVGLGALSDSFGKAACLQRIDLDHGNAGIAELALEAAMIGAGGLEDDAMDFGLAEPCEQGFNADGGVCELPGDGLGVEVDVESEFGDVDADSLSYGSGHLFQVLCLSSGPCRPGIRSGHEEKRGAVKL
jgi:hypothetical protein